MTSGSLRTVFQQFAVLLAFAAISAHAHVAPCDSNQTDIESFVPHGYSIFLRRDGDVNGDGISDVLLVLANEKDPYGYRPLVILFRQPDGKYSLSARAEKAIPGVAAGGIATPDGFEGLTIKPGGFVISEFGGSSVRRSYDWQFRFQDGDWYLIGETLLLGGPSPGGLCPPTKKKVACTAYKVDTNFLTGDQVVTTYYDEGNRVSRRKIAKRKLIPLTNFFPQPWADQPW